MNIKNETILEKSGWTIECESPLEIRHTDGSFATNNAAKIILDDLMSIDQTQFDILKKNIANLICEYENENDVTVGCIIDEQNPKLYNQKYFIFDGDKFVESTISFISESNRLV
jgi:hypothetical protein